MEFVYYIFLPALAGGIIQGVTGFGAGVVMMMFLPLQYSVVQSAGISSAICMILCAAMVYRYRKTINFKKIIAPAILYLAISSISILFAKMINQEVMKIILGIFLIILSLYFLFFNKYGFNITLSFSISSIPCSMNLLNSSGFMNFIISNGVLPLSFSFGCELICDTIRLAFS